MSTITYSPVGTASASATAANPINVTCANHPFSDGDAVLIVGYTQMTAANGQIYNVDSVGASNFTLRNLGTTPRSIDGTATPYGTAETSGGTAILGLSAVLDVPAIGEDITVTLAGTWVATVLLEREKAPYSGIWIEIDRFTGPGSYPSSFQTIRKNERFRFRMTAWTSDSGDMVLTVADADKQVDDFLDDQGNQVLILTQAGVQIPGTLQVTGTLAVTGGITFGTLVLSSGSITDSSAAISFGDENLSTTGTLSAGLVTATGLIGGDSSLGIDGQAAAQGGAILVTGGVSSTAGNAGGAVGLVGGTPGSTGIGGAVNLTGAVGGSASGAGGAVVTAGGAATTGNTAGGLISVTGGASTGSGTGGVASLVGGAGSAATGVGGATVVTGGLGNTTGAGGAATVAGGAGGDDAVGGDAIFSGGAAGGGNRVGGIASIIGGLGQGSAAGGFATSSGGDGGATGVGGQALVTGGDGGGTSGAGGAATVRGGAGINGDALGGAANSIGGAGQGSSRGGNALERGGVGGATGDGGSASVVGGAGGATSGTGGAASLTGGAGTNNNDDGGAVTIAGGAPHGTGATGLVTLAGVPDAEFQATDPSQKVTLFDDFLTDTLDATIWSDADGTDTEAIGPVIVANQLSGEIVITSGNVGDGGTPGDTTTVVDGAAIGGKQLWFQADQGALAMEVRLKITTVAESILFVGFIDQVQEDADVNIGFQATGTGDVFDSDTTDACGIGYDTSFATNPTLFMLGGVDTGSVTTAVVHASGPADGTYVTLRVEVSAAGAVSGWVDGVAFGSSPANAVAPGVPLTPTVVISTNDTNESIVTVDYIWAQQNR